MDKRGWQGSLTLRQMTIRGVGIVASDTMSITRFDRGTFVVSFPDKPWSKDWVILFRLPWDERHPVKAWLNRHCNFKQRILDYRHERWCAKAMEEWEAQNKAKLS